MFFKVAHWIRLHSLSSGTGFESHAQHMDEIDTLFRTGLWKKRKSTKRGPLKKTLLALVQWLCEEANDQ